MDEIPLRKRKRQKKIKPFNIDKHINVENAKRNREFETEARKDFELLNTLTKKFIKFITEEKEFPFVYKHTKSGMLSVLEEKAIEIFRNKIENKDYVFKMVTCANGYSFHNHIITVSN